MFLCGHVLVPKLRYFRTVCRYFAVRKRVRSCEGRTIETKVVKEQIHVDFKGTSVKFLSFHCPVELELNLVKGEWKGRRPRYPD